MTDDERVQVILSVEPTLRAEGEEALAVLIYNRSLPLTAQQKRTKKLDFILGTTREMERRFFEDLEEPIDKLFPGLANIDFAPEAVERRIGSLAAALSLYFELFMEKVPEDSKHIPLVIDLMNTRGTEIGHKVVSIVTASIVLELKIRNKEDSRSILSNKVALYFEFAQFEARVKAMRGRIYKHRKADEAERAGQDASSLLKELGMGPDWKLDARNSFLVWL